MSRDASPARESTLYRLESLALPGTSRHDLRTLSRLLKSSDPQVVLLFGSVARGDHRQGSDVDLLVLTKDSPSARSLQDAMRNAQLGIHPVILPVDSILNSDTVYPSFLAHLLEEGEVLQGNSTWQGIRERLTERLRDKSKLDSELQRRTRALRLFDRPERFRRSPVTAFSHLYTIAKATVIVQLLRSDVHEYSWTRAFDKYAEMRPDLAQDIDALKRLRPYYDASRHRPGARIPDEDVSTDDIRRLAHSAAAIAE